ncbi:MAG: sigma-54-dependent Fis family transcriptional regulator [Planctomycetota bacterium]|nr:MAG: sigma-54-dependent Fis family transcriptional regulator [Planctomycetota bacterium]
MIFLVPAERVVVGLMTQDSGGSRRGDTPVFNKRFRTVQAGFSIFDGDQSGAVEFVGRSDALALILKAVKAIAARECAVIITGETGVGKEMVARQIHNLSKRADKVFVPVDCTTLTGQLFESQLFGHIRGAFTGAVDSTLGFFRAADGGTIFFDEISEIPLALQAKLLRVLQENAVTPLGSTKAYPIDVRVLCATNCDLRGLVEEGKFRADLYYRLNVVNLEVPPLRHRKEDILSLAEYFLANQAAFYNEPPKVLSPAVKELLLNYNWPGNVREVANAMERAYVLTTSREIQPAAMPFEVIIAEPSPYPRHELLTLDDVQRKIITQTLEFTRGRKIAAAKILGIERRKLNRLIEKLNISATEKKTSG